MSMMSGYILEKGGYCMDNNTHLLMYQTEDGKTKIDVRFENETVWLSQAQISELFQKAQSTISRHIGNIFKEGELVKNSNIRFLHIPNSDKPTVFYNLDVIISVGYRVKSLCGTQFRIWANNILKEYLIKGFAMNDDLLKRAGGGNYFDELLARIRDIRSSEKVFWRKVLDIYATSIDYSPKVEASHLFFKTIQNKIHWAAHQHTAAEIIMERANATLPNMGMTSFKGALPTLSDAKVAKNYLKENEIDTLNRIVTLYLDFAELQAKRQKPMYMQDWIKKLDDFLRLNESEVLTHTGKISAKLAEEKAITEYEKYKNMQDDQLSQIEKDFIKSIDKIEKNYSKSKVNYKKS
jgi:hypothetical protein